MAECGDSGQDRAAWTIPAFSQDGVAVAEQLGLTQIVRMGHSLGGSVSIEAAQQMPARVSDLVGVNILLNPDRERTEEFIAATWRCGCDETLAALQR